MNRALIAFVALSMAAFVFTPACAADVTRFAKWTENSAVAVDHYAWKEFLDRFLVSETDDGVNRVRYGAVEKADQERLETYISGLASIDPTTLNKSEAFAYWANLYNALTVDLILDHYPLDSIVDIKPTFFASGPWKMEVVTISGETLTLDDIEHGILRGAWSDPRVHYAVNCASVSCPNLRAEPFTGSRLDDQLNDAARDYINHSRGARFDDSGRLIVSSIFDWYKEDFGETEQGVIAHLRKHADGPLARQLGRARRISKYEYDWTLNDARK